jgi:hypothetical protein
MYDKLIESLRLCVKYGKAQDALENAEQAADAIEELSKPRWIPVTERLPEYCKHVLVYAGFFQPYIEAGYYCEDRKWRFTYDDTEIVGVSHWMPLPEPPKEET